MQPYRWLVRTEGSPLSVAAENRNRGTRAWRLPGPAMDFGGAASGVIRGYPARETIAPGQSQAIYVSAPGATSIRIRIFRIGFYGGSGGREVLRSDSLPAPHQPPCAHDARTGLTVCRWQPSLTFRIPPALPSGVYVAQLIAHNGASDCLFVVSDRGQSPLLAQLPTATYEAYNAWGGDSLYPGGSDPVGVTGTTQGVAVSLQRPYDSITGAGQFFLRDVAMVRFLERYGYPVGYTTSEGLDADPSQARGRRALLDFGHSEYWSERQVEAFTAARDHGTSLIFLSSDTMAWRIRFGRGGGGQPKTPDETIVSYKEHAALDPARLAPTGAFGAAAAQLTGSRYTGCITPRFPGSGPPRYRLYGWSPSPGLKPSWLFRGTGMTAATVIPGIVGYELDALGTGTPATATRLGGGTAPCMSTGAAEPGEPTPPPRPGRADTTLLQTSSGALVFATGTLSWELGLEAIPGSSPEAPTAPEPALVGLTRNLLARVLG